MTVGSKNILFGDAMEFAGRYLSGTGAWSYPAYDAYPGHSGSDLGRQDLLAAALLNAHQNPLESYYGLESLLPVINGRMADPALTGSLSDADQPTLDAIARLFGILDEHPTGYVRLTKLSKVLHRKRPELIPLYDANIYSCYTHDGPIPKEKNRSWHDFSRLLLPAMQHDLTSQMDSWQAIAGLARRPKITPLRAMDIIGWHLGGQRGDAD